MSEPILKVRSAPINLIGYMINPLIIALAWVLFDVMTFALVPRTLLGMLLSQVGWFMIILIFQLLFLAILIGNLRRSMRIIKWSRYSIMELTIYNDYVVFLTRNGDEHRMSIEDFNPCIIEYIPPAQASPPPSPPPPMPPPPPTIVPYTYGPGIFIIRISQGAEEYFLFIMAYQYSELKDALVKIKKSLDWCSDYLRSRRKT
ncbi:hypothetical protein [Vulcanisaeta sp. JCM 14467]